MADTCPTCGGPRQSFYVAGYEKGAARVAELEAAIQSVYDVLGSGDDEDVDSPGNMAFAVLMSVCPLQMKGDEAK